MILIILRKYGNNHLFLQLSCVNFNSDINNYVLKLLHMETNTSIKNWITGTNPNILENIHQKDVNITIYKRDINLLEKQINALLKLNIELKSTGDIDTIIHEISRIIKPNDFQLLLQDIKNLLSIFGNITGTKNLKLFLATINTNMCRKFHSDVNDLRMLCTYSGPGTLWLKEDNINRKALEAYKSNEAIVIDENTIQQVDTGAVTILKGSKYAGKTTKAVVHRSPTIEEKSQKRLLLRIDTNEFLKTSY